jgi:hypothetical protein
MNIAAADLKRALRQLSPIKTETFQVSETGVSAQDSDSWPVVSCPLTGLGSAFNVQGKKLTQVVNKMSGQIEITREDKKLTLRSAKAKIELEIQPARFAASPKMPDKWVSFDPATFKKALSLAVASASPAKSAPFGGVVQVQNQPLGLEDDFPRGYRIVGTDAVILTVTDRKQDIPFQFKWLLNLTTAGLVQLMDGNTLEAGETNQYLVLRSGNTTVCASKPVQVYPNFEGLLASPPSIKFGFTPEEWLSALQTVEPLIDESVDQGAVALHFKDGVVQLSSVGVGSTAQDEAGYEQLEPDVFDPQEVKLRLNVKFLNAFLSKAKGPAVFGVAERAVRLETKEVTMLCMPMKEKP